jgi:hypothetical protein
MLELQKVYKNLHSIQSISNFDCFIDIFVSMKIKLLRLSATLKVAQLSKFIFLKFRIIF